VANLNQDQLRRLARLGAVARLEQLKEEEAAIRAEFPELFGGRRGNGRAVKELAPRKRRRRSAMTAAQRKEVSERMRKYWAERRKASTK
jgi:uncharacterized protein (UPF0335 family)